MEDNKSSRKTAETNIASAALKCSDCSGCSHAVDVSDGWCYMFQDQPESLPCAQHDKYALERRATGRLIRDRPEILAMIMMGMGNHL